MTQKRFKIWRTICLILLTEVRKSESGKTRATIDISKCFCPSIIIPEGQMLCGHEMVGVCDSHMMYSCLKPNDHPANIRGDCSDDKEICGQIPICGGSSCKNYHRLRTCIEPGFEAPRNTKKAPLKCSISGYKQVYEPTKHWVCLP